MDLQTYLRILRKRWKVIPLVTLIVLAVAAGVTYLMPRAYASQVQFFVSTVDTSNNSELAQGSNFLQQRVKSYSQLLTAPVILDPVINDLGLSITPDELAEHVTATIPPDTVLIDVSVTAGSAREAQAISAAIGEQFPSAVSDLEQVSDSKDSPVKVTLTKSPTFNSDPVSPNPLRNLGLGLVLGLLLGLGTAILRQVLDTKVRIKEDVEDLAEDIAVIGTIPYDASAEKQPLLAAGPHSMRSESFRALRTNLAFVGTAERVRRIVMTSSLPGEGKTTTTANLALVLAESGASVCLVEADLRRPRLLEYFGLEGAVGLTDLLIGRAALADVLQTYGRHELALLGAGQIPPNPSELLGSPAMREALRELSEKFDYVLLDAPPLLPVTDAAVLTTIADGALMVVGSGLVTRDQLATALDGLEAVDGRVLGVTLNRLPRNVSGARYYDYKYQYRPRRERAEPPVDWNGDREEKRPSEDISLAGRPSQVTAFAEQPSEVAASVERR